jgi:hypothetical protein
MFLVLGNQFSKSRLMRILLILITPRENAEVKLTRLAMNAYNANLDEQRSLGRDVSEEKLP